MCRVFLSLCLLLLPFHARAQEVRPIQQLSQEIHEQLDSLKQQSRLLTEQLLIAEKELEESSLQVGTLKTELSDLNTCLNVTNEKLSYYSLKLTQYEDRLKRAYKWLVFAGVLIIIWAALTLLHFRFSHH